MEDALYQLLAKPYRRKNAPFDSLEELHMVRGDQRRLLGDVRRPRADEPEEAHHDGVGAGRGQREHGQRADALRARRAPARPTAELCTDPTQMQLFVTGVTMAQGITMGAPLFGSPADFIETMKGQGMLGPLLTTMGMKPVKFQSESEFAKSITTESKVFSIYAVGVVKGYKRETRVRIHAVVDFRTAPSLAQRGRRSVAGGQRAGGRPGGRAARRRRAPATGPNALHGGAAAEHRRTGPLLQHRVIARRSGTRMPTWLGIDIGARA